MRKIFLLLSMLLATSSLFAFATPHDTIADATTQLKVTGPTIGVYLIPKAGTTVTSDGIFIHFKSGATDIPLLYTDISSPTSTSPRDLCNQINTMINNTGGGGGGGPVTQSGPWNVGLNAGTNNIGRAGIIRTQDTVDIRKTDTVNVKGPFFQTTQPVSAASLPLPSGAATSASQTTGNTSLSSIVTNTTGLATSSNQTTTNTSLSTIVTNTGNIPAKGNATMANSSPVTMSSDQTAIPTKGSNTEVTYSVASPANNAVMLASTDVSAYKTISLQITSNATSGTTVWQGCNDNTNWNNILAVDPSTNSANSALVTSSTAARGVVIPVLYRYFRIINTGTGSTTSAGTIEYLTWLSPTLANISYVIPNTPFSVTQSGPWTVQPGNTANTTPWIIQLVPGTSGGTSDYHLISAAGLNATTVKNAGGQLYGYDFYNSNAAVRYVKFYNKATAPTVGVDLPVRTVAVPPGGRASYHLGTGMLFTIGVSIGTTTGMADNDNGVVGSADLSIEIDYK